MREVPGRITEEQGSDGGVLGVSCAQLATGDNAGGMVETSNPPLEEGKMRTPPDFEPPRTGRDSEYHAEFKRIYIKLEEVMLALAEIRSDRRWYKWMAASAGAVVIALVGMAISWNERLSTVERRQDSHAETSAEIHNGLRRDVTRNALDIERMDHQQEWRPREAERKEK